MCWRRCRIVNRSDRIRRIPYLNDVGSNLLHARYQDPAARSKILRNMPTTTRYLREIFAGEFIYIYTYIYRAGLWTESTFYRARNQMLPCSTFRGFLHILIEYTAEVHFRSVHLYIYTSEVCYILIAFFLPRRCEYISTNEAWNIRVRGGHLVTRPKTSSWLYTALITPTSEHIHSFFLSATKHIYEVRFIHTCRLHENIPARHDHNRIYQVFMDFYLTSVKIRQRTNCGKEMMYRG